MNLEARKEAWSRRIRIMMQHTWLIATVTVLLGAGAVALAFHVASQPKQLRIAVGPSTSDEVRLIHAIAAHLARERASVRLQVSIQRDGVRAAAAEIDRGAVDLAVVRRDTGMPRDGQAVAILRNNVVVFVVPSIPDPAKASRTSRKGAKAATAARKAPVEKIEDLIGRRLGVVGRSQNNIDLLRVILLQYNITADKIEILAADIPNAPNAPGKVNVVRIERESISSAIRDGNFDVIMSVGPISSPVTSDVIAAATRGREPPTFLSIAAAEAIAERNPSYDSTEIKAGAFGGSPPRPEESVDTIGFNHYIVAHRRLSENTVVEFTRQLFAARQAISAELPAAAKIETPSTDKDAAVPVHPGAAAYIDGEVKTFFDRYSDLMYWGLMLFSLVGSGIAGMMSYSKAGDRVRRLRALERLLDISRAAHRAMTLQALDELHAEMDAIQADMIREVERNRLDETAMTAFALSFERAQTALSERRAALLGQTRTPLPAVAAV